jgi:hypothetical protein
MSADDYTIASDKLRGVAAIAGFRDESIPKTYRALESGRIPAGKDGTIWIASKRAA